MPLSERKLMAKHLIDHCHLSSSFSVVGFQNIKFVLVWTLILSLLVLIPSESIFAQDVARELYVNTLTRERALRSPSRSNRPTLQELRSVIYAYQEMIRRYPTSSYSDNAQWQGSGVALEAFDRFRNQHDLQVGLILLRTLPRDYPKSLFVAIIKERIQQFESLNAQIVIRKIVRQRLADIMRITIQLDGEIRYREERLEDASQLFFDLYNTAALPPLKNAALTFDDGELVPEIRLDNLQNEITRVILDLKNVSEYSVFTLYNPYRLIVDLQKEKKPIPTRVENTLPLNLSVPVSPETNSGGTFSLARQLGLDISRIVIDPGHGGHDPGARHHGLSESELVLDIAIQLKNRLERNPRFEAVLTRETDRFVSLEERTALANQQNADLFLSIHANASKNTSSQGVETYFLNFASDPEAEVIAARENSASGRSMHNLPSIVQAITLNNKIDESQDLAETVQKAMIEKLRPANPNLRDLGVKQAPFVVLIGAGMPSVLAEVSFVSHQTEAQLLKTSEYRRLIANALFDAIIRYQQSLKNIQTIVTTERLGAS